MLQMESRIWQQASKNSWRNALMIRRLGSPWVKALTHFHIIPYQCLRGSHPSGSLSSLCSRLLAIVFFLQNTSADCLDNRHINISAPCNSDTRNMFQVLQKSRSLNFSVSLQQPGVSKVVWLASSWSQTHGLQQTDPCQLTWGYIIIADVLGSDKRKTLVVSGCVQQGSVEI